MQAKRSRAALCAWLFYMAFVVYGSLVPLDFRYVPLEQAWELFKHTPFLQLGVESRADWVANGVLYVPLGFLGVRALGVRSQGLSAVWSLAIACVVAFVVEFTQLYFPPRTVSQNDLLAECIGSLIGVMAALGLGPWLARVWHAWERAPSRLAQLALQAYSAGYVLYCFFPFDLLLSRQEFADKMAAGGSGWLFATTDNPLRAAMLFLVEIVLTIPVGLGLTARRPALAVRYGVVAGALLGLLIEVGQLFIATGVSQGASVLSRAAAVGLGAWARSHWRQHSLEAFRSWVSRHLRWLLPVYLVPLVYGSGLGGHAWLGWDRALQSWSELRLLPFYYHYFVSEAEALKSLGRVVVMFSPLAVLMWSRRAHAIGAGLMAAIISLLFEFNKLFMADIHPDPTDVLLAGFSAWLLAKALELATRLGRRASRQDGRMPGEPVSGYEKDLLSSAGVVRARRADSPDATRSEAVHARAGDEWHSMLHARHAWAWAVLVAVLWAAATWPAYSFLVLGVVAAATAASWWRPACVLIVIPMAMPIFDLSAWSGRFFFDEFDLLCSACLAVCIVRVQPRLLRPSRTRLGWLAFAFFGFSLCFSALKTLAGGWAINMNSFSHYYSAYNGLRIVKGALWAWLFMGLYGSLVQSRPARARLFHAGIAAGLALTVVFVLWERAAFVSLLDLSTNYRVTGPFSVMNKGGAYVECFLAAAAAVVAVEMVTCRSRVVFWGASILLLLASYAVLITYSRNGYAALACGVGVALMGGWRWRRRQAMSQVPVLALLCLVGVAGAMVVASGFARARLDNTGADLQTRWSHWNAALGLRDDRLSTDLFGVGLGRFPYTHYWVSRSEPRAASFTLEPGSGNAFLRLGTGTTVYIEQIVNPPAGRELSLTINVRSATSIPSLSVTLCRKSMLTSDECEEAQIKGIRASGVWQTQYASIAPLPAARNLLAMLAPIKLSIATPATGNAVDVDNVSLAIAGTGNYLVSNGSFGKGMDRWFFATDVDPPWHIHSLPVAVLFDQGWAGLAAATAMLVVALAGGVRALRHGQMAGVAALAGLVAFLASGTLNTLIDEPRFLWLLLAMAWLCVWHGKRPTTRTGRGAVRMNAP